MRKKNILMAVLAYLGPFIIISYLAAKDDQFVKFHIKQGLALILVSFIAMIVGAFTVFPLGLFIGLIKIFLGLVGLLGILNALQGKEKELPLIGSIAKSFDF